MRDLMQLLREDTEAQERMATYGVDPTALETYLQDRRPQHRDPTADEALYRVSQWEKKRRAAR